MPVKLYTIVEFGKIIAEAEDRDPSPIINELKHARGLLNPVKTDGPRGAWLFAGEEICTARLLLLASGCGPKARELDHLAFYFKLGQNINGKPQTGVPALISAIRTGTKQTWGFHFWSIQDKAGNVRWSGEVAPYAEILSNIQKGMTPAGQVFDKNLISHHIIPANQFIKPLVERIDAEVE